MTVAQRLTVFVPLVMLLLISWTIFIHSPSPDLYATMIAGHFWADDQSEAVYAFSNDGLFQMLPPPQWQEWLLTQNYQGEVYPYIYPPVWLPFGAVLAKNSSFEQVSLVAHFINPILFWATLVLALKVSVPRAQLPLFVLLSTGLALSSIGTIAALSGNQPQILVAFLIVVAIERDQTGHPRLAGVALAIAAAIKIYPALLAVIWLANRRWRPVAAFAAAGSGLAVLSLIVGGLQLNMRFLHELASISATALVTRHTAFIDSFLAQTFFAADLRSVTFGQFAGDSGSQPFWLVLIKPPFLRLVDLGLLTGSLLLVTWLARRTQGRDPLIWALAMMLISLTSPLSWIYHYIAPLAFAPALLGRLRADVAIMALAAAFIPLGIYWPLLDVAPLATPFVVPGLMVVSASFLVAILRTAPRLSLADEQ